MLYGNAYHMADPIEAITDAIGHRGVVRWDPAGQTIYVQADPETWPMIEEVAERNDWEVVERSEGRAELRLDLREE